MPKSSSSSFSVLFPCAAFAITVLMAASSRAETAAFTGDQIHFFETSVRPLLAEHCYSCHGPEKQNNGLRLDSRASILRGSDYGPVAVAGKPEESKLLRSIRHENGVEAMPKKAPKLSDGQIAVLTNWVQQGLPWPEESGPASSTLENWRQHWAFQPVTPPTPPEVQAKDRVWQPMDAFVLARLEKAGISPSAKTDRATRIRRAYLDLTGLPPAYEQVQAFVNDPAPDAWPRLVDQLLASPHFGERWARRWMDIARYADTKGYVFQEERRYPYAYTYRDWLVRAFNTDLPYNQFLIRQIAADQAVDWNKDPQELAAMGFLTLGRRFLNHEPDIIDDRLDVVFRGTLALTVSCSRCHDHKFDPIPTADYYSLYGVFASSTEPADKPLLGQPDDSPEYRAFAAEVARQEEGIAAFRRANPPQPRKPLPYINFLNPYQEKKPYTQKHRNELRALLSKLEKFKATNPAAPPRGMVMVDKPQPVEPVVFMRGNPGRHGPKVPRRFLKALTPEGTERPAFTRGSGRLEMAEAIASPQNPLVARVWVNRVWGWLMGAPLVDTPSDFGVRTAPPDNPELLDHLAGRFMAEGWSTKQLVRNILLSSTWQQSSDNRPDAAALDRENRLFWRQNRRRLDFEALRDSLLAASGNLDRRMGGRGEEMVTGGGPSRRTLYGLVDRQNLPGLFRTFDFASPDATAPKRFETTVPQQALFMMNSPFVTAQAEHLAALPPDKTQDPETIRQLYRSILSREPAPEEIQLGLEALRDLSAQTRQTGTSWQNGWGGYDPDKKTVRFNSFPHYRKDHWTPAPAIPSPDGALGYGHLTPHGGHPGADKNHSVIRRWTAAAGATVNLSGTAVLQQKTSDGITASIVHSRHGILGSWNVPPEGKADTSLAEITVAAGDTIDFIVDCGGNPDSDTFQWAPEISDTGGNGVLANATRDFGGPGASALTAYAQVLMCSNEFLFLD